MFFGGEIRGIGILGEVKSLIRKEGLVVLGGMV